MEALTENKIRKTFDDLHLDNVKLKICYLYPDTAGLRFEGGNNNNAEGTPSQDYLKILKKIIDAYGLCELTKYEYDAIPDSWRADMFIYIKETK